jgi:hypothetical protein
MAAKAFRTIREAIHHTATACGVPMKALAADLDYSPSDLSMRTTLAEDARAFPADDRLIRLQELTGDHSILATMADRLGYEVRPKADRYPELLQRLTSRLDEIHSEFAQLKIMIPLADSVPAGKRGRA